MSTEPPKPQKTPTPRPSQEIATVSDVRAASADEKKTAALATVGGVLAIVATVLGAYFFAIDHAEAAGVREAAKGLEAAAKAKEALDAHVAEEREARKDMREGIYRLEKKQDAMLMRWNIPNPAPTPTP